MITILYNPEGYPCGVRTDNGDVPLDEMNSDFCDFLIWNEQQETPLDLTSTITISKTWEEIKLTRNALLSTCDWTQLNDTVLTAEEKTAWQDYRQLLRDIPQDYLTPDDVIFPTPPNEVI